MSELTQDVNYLRACLKESLLELHVRSGIKSARDVVRDSRIVETLLLVLDKIDALEKRS